MKGAWIVTYVDAVESAKQGKQVCETIVCSSLPVVLTMFPQLWPARGRIYRTGGAGLLLGEKPDEQGRMQIRLRRVRMYRPGDLAA